MRRTGFTLIELLVVILIITMLISILMPALNMVKQRGRAVVCKSNVRQLMVKMAIYEQDNRSFPSGFVDLSYDLTPPPGGYVGKIMYDKRGWWWFHFLVEDDIDKGSIAWCPSRKMAEPWPKDNILCGNYGVNQSVCKDIVGSVNSEFVGPALGTGEIKNPARTLLIIDSGYSLINWMHATETIDPSIYTTRKGMASGNASQGTPYIPGLGANRNRSIWPGQFVDAIQGRHPQRKVNAGFADGHVSQLKADGLLVEEQEDKYKNISPLWRPN